MIFKESSVHKLSPTCYLINGCGGHSLEIGTSYGSIVLDANNADVIKQYFDCNEISYKQEPLYSIDVNVKVYEISNATLHNLRALDYQAEKDDITYCFIVSFIFAQAASKHKFKNLKFYIAGPRPRDKSSNICDGLCIV